MISGAIAIGIITVTVGAAIGIVVAANQYVYVPIKAIWNNGRILEFLKLAGKAYF